MHDIDTDDCGVITDDNNQQPTNVLIATNVSIRIFENIDSAKAFKSAFAKWGEVAEMYFFKSFKRVKIVFVVTEEAILAREKLDVVAVGGSDMCLWYGENRVVKIVHNNLDVPAKPKAYLISPPCSPPIGWEPSNEDGPKVNMELVEAISRMQPDDILCELHPAVGSMPRIVVELSEDPDPECIHKEESQSTVQFGKYAPKGVSTFKPTARPPVNTL